MKVLGEAGLGALCQQIKASQAGGGTIYGEFFGEDFDTAIRAAIQAVKDTGKSVIDMTAFTGEHDLNDTVVIDTPCTILLGAATITLKSGEIMFDIQANNVTIKGIGRATDEKHMDESGQTKLVLDRGSRYHISARGFRNIYMDNMSLVGKQSTSMLNSVTVETSKAGAGGVFIDEYPGKGTGDAANINLTNLFIYGSYCHGIYMGLCITSSIQNCRISKATGACVYINGGTSISMINIYAASSYRFGFVLKGLAYSTMIGCVSEYTSLACWVRSCKSVTINAFGCESTQNMTYSNLSDLGYTVTNYDGTTTAVKDLPSESWSYGSSGKITPTQALIGMGILVTGGQNIGIYQPYFTNLSYNYTVEVPRMAAITIVGGASNVTVDNPYWKDSKRANKQNHDYAIGLGCENVTFTFNDQVGITNTVPYSDVWATKSIVFNGSETSYIRSGRTIYPTA